MRATGRMGKRTVRATVSWMADPPVGVLSDGVVGVRVPILSDADDLAVYGSDEALLDGVWVSGGGVSWPDSRAWAFDRVEDALAGWSPPGSLSGASLSVVLEGRLVGFLYLGSRGDASVELSYGIAPPFRGRGIATRAVLLATKWLLGRDDCSRVELRISAHNVASLRVAEKAGFVYSGEQSCVVAGTQEPFIDRVFVRVAVGSRSHATA